MLFKEGPVSTRRGSPRVEPREGATSLSQSGTLRARVHANVKEALPESKSSQWES